MFFFTDQCKEDKLKTRCQIFNTMPIDDKEDNAKLGSEDESKDAPGACSAEGEHPLDSSGEGDMIRKKPRVNSPRGNSPIGKASIKL